MMEPNPLYNKGFYTEYSLGLNTGCSQYIDIRYETIIDCVPGEWGYSFGECGLLALLLGAKPVR